MPRDRIGNQARAHMAVDRPADDSAAISIHNQGEIRPSIPRTNIGDIGKAQLVRSLGHEVTPDKVGPRGWTWPQGLGIVRLFGVSTRRHAGDEVVGRTRQHG